MIKDITELNFPAYATLETATATIADMGDRTISAQIKIDGDVVPDFSYDWEVEFKGERYIHPVKTPQGTKDNSSLRAKIDLVFQHWAIYEMKRQYFVEMASTSAGTAIVDKYIASMGLNLEDFVTAFNLVLNHYFGGRIIISLNPNPLQPYSKEAKFVSISYSYIWDVLQQMHEIYGVRWTLKTNADGVCEILMGYPAEEVSHIFEYGFEGGLLSVQRQVQSTEIRNRLLGRGGSKNLPYRYFKDKDPNNPLFEADPDWIPELANITFTELRGKTFRDYVRGWKAKRYGGTPMAEPTEAYLIGYNAEEFDPIEYVDDKESIEKYGVLVGALKNNEEIYPSIQGAPGDVDIIVDAEQVTDDDVDAAVENDAVETNVDGMSFTKTGVKTGEEVSINVSARNAKVYFSVPEGKKGTINEPSYTAKGKYGDRGNVRSVPDGLITVYRDKCTFTIHEKSTGEQVSRLNIPPGEYYYEAMVVASHAHTGEINLTASVSAIHLITSTDTDSGWHQTFDIWVRNIWNSSRNTGETDQQYADRVWLPILGDRMGDEVRVVFASGWLSFSSDWEFPIVGYAFDDSKTGSHWRLTLAKIDAEKDAGRPFIPYEGYNASPGDRFFFIGIDMPWQYVYWGEERVDDYKRDRLPEIARINPSWVIKTDKVRLNQERINENDEKIRLIDNLKVGSQIRLANKQFISGVYESLYIQSISYNWTTDTILYPDVEIVVSDKVTAVKNPVAQMQGSIETLQRQVGSLSNIQQIIRQVCDQIYLRKDGVEDLSKSPTRFLGKVTGEKFRQGQIGGRDWGIYRDENGNAIFEADKLVARQGILVSDLVVNEATYVGGLQINSAASMKITAVEETEAGYICYFDQQQGSVTNKFKVDDVALCQKFDPEYNEVKFYKRRIVATGETSVTLSKTDVNGGGIPAVDDEIIHYGNYTDKNRQFVIIRDVIGGGYERMLMGLDSVTSDGIEYYFAGKSADSKARWFVGDKDQYAEYKDGQLIIKGNIFVTGSDQSIEEQIAQLDFIKEAFGDGMQGLILGTAIIVGYNNDQGDFVPMAGMSGVFDEDSDNGGPAAWYGGTLNTAKIVFNMDGSGYLADKNISWDKAGSVTFSDNIKISAEGDKTLGTVLTFINKINSWFEFDEEAKMIKAKYGLYSLGAITAKGKSSSAGNGTGGGSSTLAGLTDVSINTPTDGQVLVYDKASEMWVPKTISVGGVTAIDFSLASDVNNAITLTINNETKYITAAALKASLSLGSLAYKNSLSFIELTNKPTTLSGYGITDAVIYQNGIDTATDFKKYGYGHASGGWRGSGPAMIFGVQNYNIALQSSNEAADYVSLYVRNKYNGVEYRWDRIVTEGLLSRGSISFDTSAYKCLGDIVIHRNSESGETFLNYGVANTDKADLRVFGYNIDFVAGEASAFKTYLKLYADGYAEFKVPLIVTGGNVGIGTTSPAYKLDINGQLNSANFVVGAALTSDPTESFQTTVFGSNDSLYFKMRLMRPGNNFDRVATPYATTLCLKSGDTHGYISIPSQESNKNKCYIGGGNANKINWKGALFHDNMDLLPVTDDSFAIGSASQRYKSLAVSTSIRIGDATLSWDAKAGMLKFDKGIYSTGAVTAGGKGSSNKYRLDSWDEWTVDSDGNVTDAKLLESSLSAKLGVELNKRLAEIEESANIDSVKIDLEYIRNTTTLTPSQALTAGLTEDVINNMLAGKYTKVIHVNDAIEVWDYTAYGSGNSISIYLTQGDGFIVKSGIEIRRDSITANWNVIYEEI